MGETRFTREELLRISSEMAQAGGMEQEGVYEGLCYLLGSRYWGHEYAYVV